MSYPQGQGPWQSGQPPQQMPPPPGYPVPQAAPPQGYPLQGFPPPGQHNYPTPQGYQQPMPGGYPPPMPKPPKKWPAYDAGATAIVAAGLILIGMILGLANDNPEGVAVMVGVTMFDGISRGAAAALTLVLAVPAIIGGILLCCRLPAGRWIAGIVGVIGFAHYLYALIYLLDKAVGVGLLVMVAAFFWAMVPIGALRPKVGRAMKGWTPGANELPRY